jgi:hypothetical protein
MAPPAVLAPPSHVRRAYDHTGACSLARLTRARRAPHHFWVEEAAAELRVTWSAARQMMLSDRFPYVVAANGRRYVRRHQLDVIVDVREARAFDDDSLA